MTTAAAPHTVRPGVPPLPRSLAPLPGEEISGYLLRLAHRLEQTPHRLAELTGLQSGGAASLPVRLLLRTSTEETARFARACSLTSREAEALCLASLADRYPPADVVLHPLPGGRSGLWMQQADKIASLDRWVFTRPARYCPACLAGDTSELQQHHGGPWQKLWRLPLVFACPLHRCLLATRCPACRQPIGAAGAGLISQPCQVLHPAQCRAPAEAAGAARAGRGRLPACGHRLDTAAPPVIDAASLTHVLAVQDRLLTLLSADDPAMTSSMGVPVPVAEYVLDLRLVAGLIRCTWPAAAALAGPAPVADALADHVEQRRRRQYRPNDHGHHRTAFSVIYDAPPTDPLASAGLFTAAERILTGETGVCADRLEPLLAATADTAAWRAFAHRASATCSPALRATIQTRLEALHRPTPRGHNLKSDNTRRNGTDALRAYHRRMGHLVVVPTGDCRFDHRHIPQHMTDAWFDECFPDLTGISPVHLRRTAAIRLVQMSTGGSQFRAGERLGITPGRVMSSTVPVRAWTQDLDNDARFAAAIDAFARELNTTIDPIDYSHRRAALHKWEIPPGDWLDLLAQLVAAHPHTHISWWQDRKRRLASVLVWATVTQGDHRLAPLVLVEHRKANHGKTNMLRFDLQQARYRARNEPDSPTAALISLLGPYSQRLATKIDQHDRP
ncbi:TniQ family protein [Actinomadura opuntiae]|uniref:TniQ family protein n=1 Tax=Actinomadura sp. OS1-43 TaxID=604315 RepID=UPI00255B2BBD|nr:TniQ family protein [Actinomadura sp. OS1-43]MDL4813183.1 TniQ family protein [Actinomadura sp. OS1-43]